MNRRQLLLAGLASFLARYTPQVRAADSKGLFMAEACNAFAIDYYAKMSATNGNLFFSPFSVATAFGMTTVGAASETRKQMMQVFHRTRPELDSDEGFGELLATFNNESKDPKTRGYQLSVANALWGQEGYKWEKAFIDTVGKYYGGGLREVDFVAKSAEARKIINTWVEDKTNQKIKDLIPDGVLTPLTRLVLTNAIYFKGDWATQFKKEATSEAPFYLNAKDTVKAPLMYRKGEYPLYESPDLQALELPYKGNELGMVVLLPRRRDGLEALEKGLTLAGVTKIVQEMRIRRDIELSLPKFKIEQSLNLKDGLVELGMKDAWSSTKADFSGMNGVKHDLYIAAALHKAFVEVNEEGTEAAAATAVIVATRSAPLRLAFRADHPFMFLIREKTTGAILFMGRMAKPV